MLWSFSRLLDFDKIQTEEFKWQGPFSWIGYEKSPADFIPNIEGVYLFTFEYKDGYLISGVGITNSMKRRFQQHTREFKLGKYTVLDPEYIKQGRRYEVWHGWGYAREHAHEFEERKSEILTAVDKQLSSYKIFVLEMKDKRMRERLEWAIATNLYVGDEFWSDIIDRGTALKGRYTFEMPLRGHNILERKIYGLSKYIEI